MRLEMAPMEGITTYIYRNAYAHYFGKIDKYYTPFLSLHKEKEFSHKEKNEILPEHNAGIQVIPQVLTGSSTDFLRAARQLAALGYGEININMGCPSGTVTAKGKGAGMLADAAALERFLDEIFQAPLTAISIKTRLGFYEPEEWDRLLAVYRQYPLKELIVHARVREDFYENRPNWVVFGRALEDSPFPICYNGDIFCEQDYEQLTQTFPALEHMMLGRGLLADPALVDRLRQSGRTDVSMTSGTAPNDTKAVVATQCRLRAFHDEIYQGYQELQMGERNVLFRMKELWTYMIRSFQQADKFTKKIRKANCFADYEAIINQLFAQ